MAAAAKAGERGVMAGGGLGDGGSGAEGGAGGELHPPGGAGGEGGRGLGGEGGSSPERAPHRLVLRSDESVKAEPSHLAPNPVQHAEGEGQVGRYQEGRGRQVSGGAADG